MILPLRGGNARCAQVESHDIKGRTVSDPYVIWTMRRTGGTTLATLLSTLSEHRGIQHEPFNPERLFGHISDAFMQTQDTAQLRAALQECLADRPVIKHCYELMPEAFNTVFLDVTSALGYRHIVLDRRSETDRILSLELAHLTGAWGGEAAREIYPAIEAGEVTLAPVDIARARRQMTLCRNRRLELARLWVDAEPGPFVVYFEDVYSDPQQGRALIARLLAFLGIRPEDHAGYDAMVDDALLKRGQNSARILQAVPNADAAIAELDALHSTQAEVFAAS